MEIIVGLLDSIIYVFSLLWWIILPVALFFGLRNIWLIYARNRFINEMKWALLEIKIPKDILKTPKAMEQVFSAMYASYSHGLNFWLQWLDGYVDDWYSFEMVGHAGGIDFYVCCQIETRDAVESAIYAQYPDAEIREAEDYMELLPNVLPNKTYNLWGTDLILKADSYYPIRTYPYFEEPVDERRLDPISSLAEVMSTLKEDEWLCWQVVICPTSNDPYIKNDWKEKGQAKIAEIAGQKKEEKKKGFADGVFEWFRNLFWAPVDLPVWGEEKKEEVNRMKFLSPAESEVVKAIDNKISKLGFETTIRWVYVAKKDAFNGGIPSAMFGTIRQFNTQNLNVIGPGNEKTLIAKDWKPRFIPYYQKWKLFSQKKKVYANYKLRRLGGKMIGKYRSDSRKIITFNIEELATIYHFPLTMVGAPKLQRVPTKRGEAPAELPIE